MIRKSKITALSAVTLVSLIISFQVFAQPLSKFDREVLESTDTRSSKIDFDFYNINQAGSRKSFSNYFLAIINLNDTALADSLIKYYKKSRIDNKEAIIQLLGYLNCSKSREFLVNQLKKENEKKLIPVLLTSLGKIGFADNLKNVLRTDAYFVEKIISFFQFASRKIASDKVYEYIKKINLYSLRAEVDYEISYIFYRTGTKESLSPYKDEIMFLTNSGNPYARMWAFSALGKLQDTTVIDNLLNALEKQDDWRVRVNICNSIGNQQINLNSPLADKITSSLLKHAAEDESAHVSITALQALGKLFTGLDTRNPIARKIQQDVQFILTTNKAIDWQIRTEAVRTYAKIFKDEIKDELLALFSQTENYDLKAAIAGSFAFMDNVLVYKELRDFVSTDVQRYNEKNPNKDGSMIGSSELAKVYLAFVQALSALDDKLDEENRNNVRLIYSEFANSKNTAITALCLANLQDSMYLNYRNETSRVMMFDYDSFNYPEDKDVSLMYIQAWSDMKYEGAKDVLLKNLNHSDYDIAKASADALKNILGSEYEKQITAPKYRTDFDWEFIETLNAKKFAVIKTNIGDIKIELLPEAAPFTVQNFIKLGEKGYYNNTIFHRVVPNFVIQGGDPTGTGYGGPGYSIRSEFSPLEYKAYTVGMASSGKDTEGSQFFITHSPQPHLDGRYTLFGKVVEGFDVVDKIQIGDKIETIVFSNK